MNNREWEFVLRDDILADGICLVGFRSAENGNVEVLQFRMDVKTQEFGTALEPAVTIRRRDERESRLLHNLAIALVSAGYATTPPEQTGAQIKAMSQHLSDMRAIVFSKLKMEPRP